MNWAKVNQQFRTQFIAEAEEHLEKAEASLLVMESGEGGADSSPEVLRALHSLKGISGVILSMLDQESVPAQNLDSFRVVVHLEESLVLRHTTSSGLKKRDMSLIFDGLDALKEILEAYRTQKSEKVDCSPLIGRMRGRLEGQAAPGGDSSSKNDRKDLLNDRLEQGLQLLETGLEQQGQDTEKAGKLLERGVNALVNLAKKEEFTWLAEYSRLLSANRSDREDPGKTADSGELRRTISRIRNRMKGGEAVQDLQSREPATPPRGGEEERTIRLPQEKIDELMNLIGEMKIQGNTLRTAWQEYEQSRDMELCGDRLKSSIETVARLTEKAHGSIMSLRLLPLSLLFSRFPRLVRDLGKRLGKELRLTIEGEDTVIDKTMIDLLHDPLIHLVRNAVDHGIEPPQERLRAGKPSQGTVGLRAYNRGRRVIIEVTDDGRGLDPERIRRQVLKRGLCEPGLLEGMNEQKLYRFLFTSGFSLSETVSDISGRGVGLDVVNSNIARIGGSIDIDSRIGARTRFLLQLPLTLVVGKGLLVESRGLQYYLPIDQVLETRALDPDCVFSYKHQEAVLVRGGMLRLFRLEDLLRPDESSARDQERRPLAHGKRKRVLILEINGERIALVADACHQEAEYVVKPLQGIVSGSAGFSGAVIAADGRVVLILDMATLTARYPSSETHR